MISSSVWGMREEKAPGVQKMPPRTKRAREITATNKCTGNAEWRSRRQSLRQNLLLPARKQMTIDAGEAKPNRFFFKMGQRCVSKAHFEKIDSIKPQQVNCHLFACRGSKI